nr:hypothetical protein [Tissierella sp.]
MKKIIAAGLIAATLAAGAFSVNAADLKGYPSERPYGYMMEKSGGTNLDKDLSQEERVEYREKRHESRINEALKDGTITQEEADRFRDHFEEMKDYHKGKGFRDGNCHSKRSGEKNGARMNKGFMNGNGMMRGNRR